jgi:hypothetical protein
MQFAIYLTMSYFSKLMQRCIISLIYPTHAQYFFNILLLLYILHLSAKRYEELLAIRLGKPFMDKNLRRPSIAPFLCSPQSCK